MAEYLESHPNLQRQSTVGDVIYVHHTPRSERSVGAVAEPVLEGAGAPEAGLEAELEAELEAVAAAGLATAETMTQPDLAFTASVDTGADLEVEAEAEAEAQADLELQAEAGLALEAQADLEIEAQAEADPEAEANPDSAAGQPASLRQKPLVRASSGWPYRTAPQGYALEFGTGRLVPILYVGRRY